MSRFVSLWRAAFAGGVALLGVAGAAVAQDYPTKTISIQVPFSAGGSTDVMGRVIAELLAEELHGTVIVENVTGASGVTGTMKVAEAPADGYSLLLSTPGPMVMLPLSDPKLPYKLWEAFRPVGLIWSQPVTLLVRKDRYATVADFVAAAKAKPGTITYGSAGIGSFNHVAGAFFASLAGLNLLHIPYQGVSASVIDTLAGNIDGTFVTAASVTGADPALHGLLVSATTRVAQLPDVPTSVEAGYPDYQLSNFGALLAPAGTPDAVIDRLVAALTHIFADSVKAAKIESFGVQLRFLPGEELKAFVAKQSEIGKIALGQH